VKLIAARTFNPAPNHIARLFDAAMDRCTARAYVGAMGGAKQHDEHLQWLVIETGEAFMRRVAQVEFSVTARFLKGCHLPMKDVVLLALAGQHIGVVAHISPIQRDI
jgi:hypothetical protein